MKAWLKRFLFGLLGKDPEPVVVSFATGPVELAARMHAEIRSLTPDRRHLLIRPEEFTGLRALRRRLRGYRIGLAAVLFSGEREHDGLRRAAFLLAPTRILAYNARLERHHLRIRTWIASLLFLRSVPLDRIFLRPSWLAPWKRDRSVYPETYEEFLGRAFRPGRRRVGVLTPYFPYPLAHGGAVRMYSLIREMAAQFDVVLLSFSEQAAVDAAALTELCSRIYVMAKPRYREPRWSTLTPPEVEEFRAPAMERLVRRVRRELSLDVLQVEYTMLAPYRGDILVEHDVTFALYRQIHERERSWRSAWDYWRWLWFERRWTRRYRRTVAMSEEDRRLLAGSNAVVVPNGVDLERFQPEPERPGRSLLFVGSFRHAPNLGAFQFFLGRVWPRVAARFEEARFIVIAGPDPRSFWRGQTGLAELPEAERLELHEFVADVRPFYVEANLAVVPTLVSAGTNLKVLEALAMERAVVSTRSGCAGLGLEHGRNVWIADGDEAFAAGIEELLEDHELRRAIAIAGREHAERHFGWRELGGRQRRLLRTLIRSRPSLRPVSAGDIAAIVAIQETAPESAQWRPEDYLGFDCTVAEWDGEIAGFLVSRQNGPDEREILNVAVHPDWRRMGVARSMIQDEMTRHPAPHFLEVRESNRGARRLYESLGFEPVGVRPGYYENPPESGIVMRIRSCYRHSAGGTFGPARDDATRTPTHRACGLPERD